jgi:hypothetical protein
MEKDDNNVVFHAKQTTHQQEGMLPLPAEARGVLRKEAEGDHAVSMNESPLVWNSRSQSEVKIL